MTFQESLIQCLAHSAVYFSRSEQWPFSGPEPRNDGKNTAQTQQTEDNEQTAGQGGGAGSSTSVGGVGSTGTGSSGVNARGNIGQQTGRNNVDITTIETSDPEIAQAAIHASTDSAANALLSNTIVTSQALNDLESTATASINAGVTDNAINASFGAAALNTAANAEANATTALENFGANATTAADNALAAAQNETLAGVTPAQEFQAAGGAGSLTGVLNGASLVTWLSVAVAIFGIIYYLRKAK